MNPPQPMQGGYSLEDWATWDGRWELIEGVAYDMTPSPSLEHQRVSFLPQKAIFLKLNAAKRGRSCGGREVFAAPLDLFFEGGRYTDFARVELGALVPLLGGRIQITLG